MAKDTFVEQIADIDADFPQWYTDVVIKTKLVDYGPVKGTMVIRPYGYAIWENIQREMDKRFKGDGHRKCLFPAAHSHELHDKEAEHVEGFAPVGRRRHPCGSGRSSPSRFASVPRRRPSSAVCTPSGSSPIAIFPSHEPVGERHALGKDHASLPAYERVPLAGGVIPSMPPRRRQWRETPQDARVV